MTLEELDELEQKRCVEAMCELATQVQISAHVRRWHNGQRGWWCVDNKTHELVEITIHVPGHTHHYRQR